MAFTPFWRRLFLVLHVVTSVGFPGAVACFLALAVVGATVADPQIARAVYLAMSLITWEVIVPLALASLILGIVQSLGTPWGLVRYYWIIIKLVLTVLAVAVLLLQTRTINMLADMALAGDLTGMSGSRAGMIVHGAGGLVVLIVATILSVYKPRGMTRRGVLAVQAARSAMP